MFWYAEALRVPLTGTKGPSPGPEKQLHTVIPLHQTATAKPRLIHQIARLRSVIGYSREQVFTALESRGVLYTTAANALGCAW